jgi:hypothetical protein
MAQGGCGALVKAQEHGGLVLTSQLDEAGVEPLSARYRGQELVTKSDPTAIYLWGPA